MPSNPSDVALLGHRYQPWVKHTTSGQELTVARVQRFEPAVQTTLDVYNELGNVDPVGYTTDPPVFRVTLEENMHDSKLDLLLAGKTVASDTTWTLKDYINDGKISTYLLERNSGDTIIGEIEMSSCVLSEVTWSWRVGQPITASYTLLGRIGKRYKAASVQHSSWGSFDTTAPGAIKAKDARVFLGGSAAGYRVYRLQGFTIRSSFRANNIFEIGSRNMAGVVVEPPSTSVDLEFAVADHQPDDIFFTLTSSGGYDYYDYANATLLTGSAIRVYDPAAAEGNTVIRAWKLENLIPGNSSPVIAQVRGLATKRYSLMVPRVTTSGTGGVLLYKGDIV